MLKVSFRLAALSLLPLALLVSGCSTVARESGPVTTAQFGTVHGGQQPVSGASVQLYSVGTTADGSAATPLLSPAPVTDANGNFNITGIYTCPSPTALVYIVATGGNPGMAAGTNNAALSLMAALGQCGTLTASTRVIINELTTVGAVYPLAPYMSSPSAIGSAAYDASSLAAAFTLASELVNTTSGTTPGTNIPTGTSVPVAQMNTIGDILAGCINSAGGTSGDNSSCGNLFSLTTPTGVTPATDTITALLHLANNPALNTVALFDLAAASAPFQPVPPAPPPDLGVRLAVPSGVTIAPTTLNFPALTVGFTSPAQTLTLTNNTAAPVALPYNASGGNTGVTGTDAADFVWTYSGVDYDDASADCDTVLPAGQSCSFQVAFNPQAVGARTAYFAVYNTSGNPLLAVALNGQGAAPSAGVASLSASALAFSSYGVPQNAVLTNYGNSTVTINAITISPGPPYMPSFTQTNNCGTSLPAQSICTISVEALPESSGNYTGVLTVVDDAAAGPQKLNLSYINPNVSGLPAKMDFGSRSIGTQGALAIQPVPAANEESLGFSISGPNASDFSFSATASAPISGCSYLRNFGGCDFNLYFNPSTLGLRTATVTVSGIGAFPVTGTGLPAGLHFLASPTSVNFSFLYIGQTSSPNFQPTTVLTVTNTGTVALTLNPPVLSGPNVSDFAVTSQCGSLLPNQTCTVTPTATPTQVNYRSAILTLTDSTASVQQAVPLLVDGFYPPPTLSSTALTFSALAGATSASQAVTVTAYNNDPISAFFQTPGPFEFTQGNSCAHTPCQLYIAFTAPAPVAGRGNIVYGALYVSDPFAGQVDAMLTGTITPVGAPVVSLSQASLTFPLRPVGSTSIPQTVMLTNTGNQPLAISSLSLAGMNPGDYVLTNNCSSTVAAGANCNFTLSFSPTVAGTRTASVQIVSNAASSPDVVQLTGTAQ